jgi:dethiobiotin synthetase
VSVLFVTGIDTGCGKTFATGWVARLLRQQGRSVTTMKLVQTGNTGLSEDIQAHRRLMGVPVDNWDEQGVTCPYLFHYPASPHLAADLEGKRIQAGVIDQSIAVLERHFSSILLEGVGGVCVPLEGTYTVLDFVAERRFPCLIVTSPRLGSINHTLLTVNALQNRGLEIKALLYNLHTQEQPEIREDTRRVFQHFFPAIPVIDIPDISSLTAIPGTTDFPFQAFC